MRPATAVLAAPELPLGRSREVLCPCGSGLPEAACCLPLIDGQGAAVTALALMRSRYTAYTLGRAGYLLDTWHLRTRPAHLDLDDDSSPKWLGLKVLAYLPDTPGPGQAIVEFVARYKVGGRAHRLHERSRFVEQEGRWFYVDGNLE